MDYELGTHSELDLFIPMQLEPDQVKIPTRKEALTARAQFLALCWSLFVIGWTDGSTGPLLLRIQEYYEVRLCQDPGATQRLLTLPQVGFGTVSWIFVLGCAVGNIDYGDAYHIASTSPFRE